MKSTEQISPWSSPVSRAGLAVIAAGLLLVAACTTEDAGKANEGGGGQNAGGGGGQAGGAGSSPSANDAAVSCTGVEVNPEGTEQDAGGEEVQQPDCPTCAGSPAPGWKLEDFQPQSCGHGMSYGIEQFKGYVVLVGLFSGWCDFCQAQTVELEKLNQELLEAGHLVRFLIVNSADALVDQQKLIDRCGFPLFQDTEESNVFGLHGGAKDDFYIYDKEGLLSAFLPGSGDAGPTILLSEPGYENVKSAILAAE